MNMASLSLINNYNVQPPVMETRILRDKVKELTKKEIELQDKIEALQQ
jgi:hypothetical protein